MKNLTFKGKKELMQKIIHHKYDIKTGNQEKRVQMQEMEIVLKIKRPNLL